MLADGVVLGSVAAVVGVALGLGAAAATQSLIEEFLTRRSGDFRIFPAGLAILLVLAVVTGVLAALVPAWSSSRQDVVTVLAGRRGITRSRRRWPILGLGLAAAGAAAAVLGALNTELTAVLGGMVGIELGLVLCTPALVGLVARIGRGLPVPARIALRDTSRNRTAAASAISAVMAAVVASLAVGVVLVATGKREEAQFGGRPGDVAVSPAAEDASRAAISADLASTIRTALPVESVHEIGFLECDGQECMARPLAPEALDCPYRAEKRTGRDLTEDEQRAARNDPRCDGLGRDHTYFAGRFGTNVGMSVVIEPDAVRAASNISAEDAGVAAEALRSGAVVVDDPRYVANGTVTLSVLKIGREPEPRTVTARGVALPHRPDAPILMMTPDTARSLGFASRPVLMLATTTRMPTVAEEDRLRATLGGEYEVTVARGPRLINQSLLVLAIVTGLIALGAAALATGLAAADGRADLGTLAAVGASLRLRRLLSLSQSGVIAGLGSVLGVIAGLGVSTAVLYGLNQAFADVWPAESEFPIGVPWLNLAVALVVVPGVAMVGAGLLTRSRLPIERRRG